MNSAESSHVLETSKAILLVCSPAGKVQAITSTASGDYFHGAGTAELDLEEVVGPCSTINQWFKERIKEAREADSYSAEASFGCEGGEVHAKLESLRRDGELYGFALQFSPSAGPETPQVITEGDSIITRRQWHEVKNHVGALKLYATFLKRKMPEGDERLIVEKIFNGVNALIGYLDKIRRGDPQ